MTLDEDVNEASYRGAVQTVTELSRRCSAIIHATAMTDDEAASASSSSSHSTTHQQKHTAAYCKNSLTSHVN